MRIGFKALCVIANSTTAQAKLTQYHVSVLSFVMRISVLLMLLTVLLQPSTVTAADPPKFLQKPIQWIFDRITPGVYMTLGSYTKDDFLHSNKMRQAMSRQSSMPPTYAYWDEGRWQLALKGYTFRFPPFNKSKINFLASLALLITDRSPSSLESLDDRNERFLNQSTSYYTTTAQTVKDFFYFPLEQEKLVFRASVIPDHDTPVCHGRHLNDTSPSFTFFNLSGHHGDFALRSSLPLCDDSDETYPSNFVQCHQNPPGLLCRDKWLPLYAPDDARLANKPTFQKLNITNRSVAPSPSGLNLSSHGTFWTTAYAVPTEGLTIISDIDDVLRVAEIWKPGHALLNIFAYPFRPWKNMTEIYKGWYKKWPSTHFHYLSIVPEVFSRRYVDFLDREYPPGSFEARMMRSLFGSREAQHREMLKRFPRRKFVLVGDTTNSDTMKLFPKLAIEFKDQITCILIRNTSATEPSDWKRYSYEPFRRIRDHNKWMFFSNPSDLHNIDLAAGQCRNDSAPGVTKFEDMPWKESNGWYARHLSNLICLTGQLSAFLSRSSCAHGAVFSPSPPSLSFTCSCPVTQYVRLTPCLPQVA